MADEAGVDELKGRCLCGVVSISLYQPTRGVDVCHCEMCQRWGGGPLFTLAGLKEDDLRIAGAEHISLYRSSEWAERAFCNRCGSNLWYHFIPAGTRSFLAGLFNLSDDYHIREQIFVDKRPEWARLAAQSAEKTGEQVMAEAKAAGLNLD